MSIPTNNPCCCASEEPETSIEFNYNEIEKMTTALLYGKKQISLDFEGVGLNAEDLRKLIWSIPEAILLRVTSLNLNDNDLESLPDEILKFKNLCDLHLSMNPLKELNPKIGELDLEVIWLLETPLTALPEESILKLKNLSTVNLGEHIVLSENFIKNVSENVRFTFDGKKGEKDFLEKRDKVKK